MLACIPRWLGSLTRTVIDIPSQYYNSRILEFFVFSQNSGIFLKFFMYHCTMPETAWYSGWSPLTDRHEIWTQVWLVRDHALKPTFENFSPPPPKKWKGKERNAKCLPTFIHCTGILKRIEGLQFQFRNITWQWCSYIVYKLGDIWSSNPGDYEVTIVHWVVLVAILPDVIRLL